MENLVVRFTISSKCPCCGNGLSIKETQSRDGVTSRTVRTIEVVRADTAAQGEPPASPIAAASSDSEFEYDRMLLEILLNDTSLIIYAMRDILVSDVKHIGLRRIYAEACQLFKENEVTIERLSLRLSDRPDLIEAARRLDNAGFHNRRKQYTLGRIVERYSLMRGESNPEATAAV